MRENKSQYAILGLLSLKSMSGYDIKKMFEKNFSYFWSESYGQIYPLLKRLLAQKLVSRSVIKQMGKPDRHLYKLTKKGNEKLRSWLLEPVKRQIGRHEILLKLIYGSRVSLDDNIRQVEQFREIQTKEIRQMKPYRKQLMEEYPKNPNLPYWLMAVSFGEHLDRAYIRWCDETLKMLRDMKQESDS